MCGYTLTVSQLPFRLSASGYRSARLLLNAESLALVGFDRSTLYACLKFPGSVPTEVFSSPVYACLNFPGH